MITFKILRFPFVVCVSHTVNELVTDIILIITSQEDLILTLLHIGSRLFELFSKEVRVKKQPGRPLRLRSFKSISYKKADAVSILEMWWKPLVSGFHMVSSNGNN